MHSSEERERERERRDAGVSNCVLLNSSWKPGSHRYIFITYISNIKCVKHAVVEKDRNLKHNIPTTLIMLIFVNLATSIYVVQKIRKTGGANVVEILFII